VAKRIPTKKANRQGAKLAKKTKEISSSLGALRVFAVSPLS
jgi:hypothetical protein